MQPPQVFVSYRRRDSAGYAISLVDGIGRDFGEDQVYQDLRGLQGGDDWSRELAGAIAASKVVVVVIGPTWAKWTPPGSTTPALFVGDDPVRREIETALATGVALLPVLVGGAAMPMKADLPPTIARIAEIHAVELSDLRWPHDMQRLGEALAVALWGRSAGPAFLRLRRLQSRAFGSVFGRAALNVLCVGFTGWIQATSTWPLPPLVADAACAGVLWLLAAAWIMPGLRPRPPGARARMVVRTPEPGESPLNPGGIGRRPSALLLAACAISSLAAAQATRSPASAVVTGDWTFCATLTGPAGSRRQVQFLDARARPAVAECQSLDDDTGLKRLRRPGWYVYRPTHLSIGCGAKAPAPVTIPESAFDGTCSREVVSP